jgi:hypothetical protein
MSVGAIFIISYCIQIPLAIYAAVGLPMRGQLPRQYENSRKSIITFGILPCAFFSVVMQLILLAIYMVKVKSLQAGGSTAQRTLDQSAGRIRPGSSGNPFGGDSGRSAPRSTGANPIGGSGRPAGGSSPQANPFGDTGTGSGSSGPSDDNPFA